MWHKILKFFIPCNDLLFLIAISEKNKACNFKKSPVGTIFLIFPFLIFQFANQILDPNESPYHTRYGDGEEIEDEVVDHIRTVIWQNAMSLVMNVGDVVVMENLLCKHSRVGYQGDRRILVHLAEPMTRY